MLILPFTVPAEIQSIKNWPKGNFVNATNMEIASDSNFSNKTASFSAGQTIYVRVTTDNDGADSHNLNVRDSNYNLITSHQFSRTGNQFITSFSIPQKEGTYSLEADIKSGGSVANYVQTIQVGQGSQSSSGVNVKIQNNVNTQNSQTINSDASPSPFQQSQVLGKAVTANFFENLWLKITNFWQNVFKKSQLTTENKGGTVIAVALPRN